HRELAGKCPSPLQVDTIPQVPTSGESLSIMRLSRRPQPDAYLLVTKTDVGKSLKSIVFKR
ncbi:MAG: hypothetical protein WBW85_25295, partial [Terriglobales bacterium]